ncbi:hypothetical protein HK099_003387 [Clydaea vesicula]|uniref:ENTH domain-containing protein n=1 Tax=Clydaea vesicula TaxID=447962 RepID=A0AAD5Y0Y3_9FUNG|nr:hypothetical protein HK099_003387 [Clydaea vesicula]
MSSWSILEHLDTVNFLLAGCEIAFWNSVARKTKLTIFFYQSKNVIGGYTDIQIKVRKATSNDPSGPAGHNLQELAAGTYNTREFNEIMEMLEKRLNDSGKNWRHALIVVDYLLHCGSESIITYAKENLYVIKTLKEFQYIDDEGRDQGQNVRSKARDITSLLADENRLREERGNGGVSSRVENRGLGGLSNDYYNEDSELQRALEESKKSALDEERKKLENLKSEKELQLAIEMSEEEAAAQRRKEATSKTTNNPFGSSGLSGSTSYSLGFNNTGTSVHSNTSQQVDLLGMDNVGFGNNGNSNQTYNNVTNSTVFNNSSSLGFNNTGSSLPGSFQPNSSALGFSNTGNSFTSAPASNVFGLNSLNTSSSVNGMGFSNTGGGFGSNQTSTNLMGSITGTSATSGMGFNNTGGGFGSSSGTAQSSVVGFSNTGGGFGGSSAVAKNPFSTNNQYSYSSTPAPTLSQMQMNGTGGSLNNAMSTGFNQPQNPFGQQNLNQQPQQQQQAQNLFF